MSAAPFPLRHAHPPRLAATLDRLAGFGPYFRLRMAGYTGYTSPEIPADPPWRPVTELHDTTSGALAGMVMEIGQRIGTTEVRVGASTFFLGYAARLLSPALGSVLLDASLPDLRPESLLWWYAPGQPIELKLRRVAGWQADDDQAGREALLDALWADVMTGHLLPLADRLRAVTPLAAGLLRGNISSALVGTLRVLAGHAALAAPAGELAQLLLARAPLNDTGHFLGDADMPGLPRFVRRSCCLYYRVPGGGTCGDCPLPPGTRPPDRSADGFRHG